MEVNARSHFDPNSLANLNILSKRVKSLKGYRLRIEIVLDLHTQLVGRWK